MNNTVNIREIALQLLMDVLEDGAFLHIQLRRALDKYDYLERSQKAMLRRLCTGCVERLVELDAVLDHFSKVPVKKQKPMIRTILRMSMYQIMYMDAIPDAAVCNEAVKLVKSHHFGQLSGFVNGVLRNAAREYKNLNLMESERYSMPPQLYQLFKTQYPEHYKEIFEAFLNHSEKGVIIRINRSRLTEPEQDYVQAIGAQMVCGPLGLYRLMGIEGVANIPGFEEGLFMVQDTASALAVYLGAPKKGDRCLDLCAAPGGKTIQMLDLMSDEGFVVSRDLSEAKLPLMQENVERCGFTSVQLEASDASVFCPEDAEQFDLVLADVPCSGLGIIGTKPDIKYHITPEGLESLVNLQRTILQNGLAYVKPGGTLVYSTCTLNIHENQEQIQWLLEQQGCVPVDFQERIPKELINDYKEKGMLTLLPHTGLNEGFFIGVVKKL
jgi:16S rRNA (cytosine967-C5)-methyltransferase